jgi:hypothetical protein
VEEGLCEEAQIPPPGNPCGSIGVSPYNATYAPDDGVSTYVALSNHARRPTSTGLGSATWTITGSSNLTSHNG